VWLASTLQAPLDDFTLVASALMDAGYQPIVLGSFALYSQLDDSLGFPLRTDDIDFGLVPDIEVVVSPIDCVLSSVDARIASGSAGKWLMGGDPGVEIDILVPFGGTAPWGEHGARIVGQAPWCCRRELTMDAAVVDQRRSKTGVWNLTSMGDTCLLMAGPGALLVGKILKLSGYLERATWGTSDRDKQHAVKTAADVILLLLGVDADRLAQRVRNLLQGDSSYRMAPRITADGLRRLDALFGGVDAIGYHLASSTSFIKEEHSRRARMAVASLTHL
jgi:hypothetical protein